MLVHAQLLLILPAAAVAAVVEAGDGAEAEFVQPSERVKW